MKFELFGYNIDGLIKTLYSKNITITNLIRDEHNHIVFEVADKDERRTEKYIKNFKKQKTLTGKRRFPKFFLENIGIVIGCVIGLVFYLVACNFVWQIKIYGTENLSNADILAVLKESDVRVGATNNKTSEDIEEILLNNYDRIAQVSVIKKGTTIIINISEKLVYVERKYEPIKAKFSGVIESVNVITGTVNVRVGEFVNQGDVLVLPYNINADGEKISVEPIAEITGTMYVVEKLEIPKIETKLVRSGLATTEYRYKFNDKNLFSGKNKNSFALFESQVYNENISNVLPLNRDVITFYELVETQVEHNFEEEKVELEERVKNEVYLKISNEEVISFSLNSAIEENRMCICSILTIKGLMNG